MIDLLRNTDSNKISSPLEFFALLIAISGIVISLILGAQSLYQWSQQHKRRKAWVKQTVLSAVKEKMIRSKEGYFQITNTWQDSVNEIIISDFKIYQRNSKYISDFKIYQRFL